MKGLILVLCLCAVLGLSGCAAGSATAAYSLRASSADDLSPKARESIIRDAVDRCKDYMDRWFVRKEN